MESNKIYIKRITVEDRTFRIELFDEFNLPHTRIVEELRPKKHFFDSGYEKEIYCYWTSESSARPMIARKKIYDYICKEKTEKEIKEYLENWADEIEEVF